MDQNNKQQTDDTKQGYQLLPLELVDDPAQPMRSDLTPESVSDLVLSIKQIGLLEPLIVKAVGSRYQVIAGHRRLLACRLAALPRVPAILRIVGSEETEILKIHENLYREDISPSDEAKHFDYLIQQLKMSPAKVAQLIGRSPTYVSERLAIFNYPPELRQALQEKKIVFSVAREFARHPDPEKIRHFLRYALTNGITPNLARQWVQDDIKLNQPKPEVVGSDGIQQDYPEVETPYYHCYLCGEGVEIIDLVPVYIHQKCDNQFRTTVEKQEKE